MSTRFISPNWRMPKNANQSKSSNYSLNFDASQYIDTNYYLPAGTKPKSISYWFKNTDPNGWSTTGYNYTIHGGALSTGAGFGMGALGSNLGSYLWFIGHSTGDYFIPASATGVMTTDVWYHIVVTYDNSRTNNLHFYLDGVKIDETNETLNTSTANSVKIGASATGGGNSGGRFMEITEACIFDYALSPSQVTTLWGGGTSVSNPMALPSPPIAYYPLGTSAWNGEYLAENNAIGDYVFDFNSGNLIDSNFTLTTGVTQFSASIWVKFSDSLGNDESLIANESSYAGDGFAIFKNASNQIVFKCEGQSATASTTVVLNQWYLATATYNSGSMILYINGQQAATQNTATSITQPSTPKTRLGKYITGNLIPFTGELSNAQIFNTALSGPEVETLYNYGSPIQTLANIPQNSNLKAWYKLDASEIYNSTSTEWKVNNATAEYKSSTFVDGLVGQATGYVQVGSYDALAGAQAGSWSFWYNTKSTAGRTKNCSWLVGPTSWIQPSGTVWRGNAEFTLNTSNGLQRTSVSASYSRRIFLDASDASSLNEWVHVVGTYDGSNLRVYVNGEQKGLVNEAGTNVVDFPATGTITTGNIQIGSGSGLVYFLSAMYSNLSIWDKALTLSEINEIYNSGQPKSLSSHTAASNLISWWTLDNFTTGLVDSIGGYNASLVGSDSHVSPGTVSILNGESLGMSQSNLVQSDLQTVAPYSKYAMSFDGTDSVTVGSLFGQVQDVFSVSTWVNFSSNNGYQMILSDNIWLANYTANNIGLDIKNSSGGYYDNNGGISQGTNFVIPSDLRTNKWIHVAFSYEGSSSGTTAVIKMYLNSVEMVNTTVTYPSGNANLQNASNVYLGSRNGASQFLDGSISNVSIWNYALTTSEVREVYNEGLPSNLNTFSGTAPIAWWQLGENSSYVGGWTFADEIGSNNGDSGNLPETALTNGVGTTANGVSSGMSEGNLVGDAPYSTANAISSGMPATARGTDVPS